MPKLANAPLGLSILYLIRQTESRAPAMARNLIARARAEIGDEALRADLLELIETIIIYKLSRLSRERDSNHAALVRRVLAQVDCDKP